MSSIYQKRDYWYYQRIFNPEKGERERIAFSLRTKDEKEAERKKEKWDEHYDRKEQDPSYTEKPFEEAMEEYLQMRKDNVDRKQLSEKTFFSDRSALRKFDTWLEENERKPYYLRLEPLQEDIRQFRKWRRKNVKENTITTNLKSLSSFVNFVQSENYLDEDPFGENGITINRNAKDYDMSVPTKLEWKDIKEEIKIRKERSDDPFWVAMWMLAKLGMRIGEVCILTWEKAFTDQKNYCYLRTSNRTIVIKFKGKKRIVPANLVWDEIQSLDRGGDTPYVFESRRSDTNSHIVVSSWVRRASEFLSDIGYEDYTAHSLRHAVVTELIRKDYSMKKIAKLVGHSHSSIVDRYAHLNVNDLQDMLSE